MQSVDAVVVCDTFVKIIGPLLESKKNPPRPNVSLQICLELADENNFPGFVWMKCYLHPPDNTVMHHPFLSSASHVARRFQEFMVSYGTSVVKYQYIATKVPFHYLHRDLLELWYE